MKKKIAMMLCMTMTVTSLAACGSANQKTADQKAEANVAYAPAMSMAPEADRFGGIYEEAMAMDGALGGAYENGFEMAESTRGEMPMEEFNTEEYDYIEENSFLSVATSPLSTFAADVDTGSYTNFRRMVKDNYTLEDIPKGAIRVEEMINYFDYEIVDSKDENRFTTASEIHACPWNESNKLLMLTVKAKDVAMESAGNNFVFLIDSSGSMRSSDKGDLAIRSFKLLAETLCAEDRVSIVTYSGDSKVVLQNCTGDKYDTICKALDSITFDGGTNGSGGITAAYECAAENFIENGNNRVIIASDGDMNLGITSNAGLTDLIKEKKETGVFLTVLGYGSGNYSDANMESIADAGNGNYYYIDCIDEAQRVLVDKLKQTTVTVAKDVKLQVEFNPLEVSEYRLIGYENRTMAAEDFEDDTKDGGETGAGQTVTVLYELVCSDEAGASDLKYQGDREITDAARSGEILTLSVRYKDPDKDTSVEENFAVQGEKVAVCGTISADFMFAAGVAELAMLLNDSAYKGTANLESAYELVDLGSNGDMYRMELAEMIQALKY